MLFVGTSIIHPSTEGVFLLCNILDLLIYSNQIRKIADSGWYEHISAVLLYIEIIKVMDLDVLPNAQCTQFHGKWAEKDRNFGVTLMIEPVFMRATREGVKIMVIIIALLVIFKEQLIDLLNTIFEKITSESSGI